jgi:negative regulator of genetic competence, sporulation and motility
MGGFFCLFLLLIFVSRLRVRIGREEEEEGATASSILLYFLEENEKISELHKAMDLANGFGGKFGKGVEEIKAKFEPKQQIIVTKLTQLAQQMNEYDSSLAKKCTECVRKGEERMKLHFDLIAADLNNTKGKGKGKEKDQKLAEAYFTCAARFDEIIEELEYY